jgi:hypothetical protein
MPTLNDVPSFATVDDVRRSLSPLHLMAGCDTTGSVRTMAQAFGDLRKEIAVRSIASGGDPVHTVADARRFIENVAEGNCCAITEEEDGLSLGVNCRFIPMTHLLSPEGMIRIGRNTFRVDKSSVTLVDGPENASSGAAAFFRAIGYRHFIDPVSKKVSVNPTTIWQLSDRTQDRGYRARLTVTQYETAYGSYCTVSVKPEARIWIIFIPVWVSTFATISIGGAFSGPASPSQYQLPNPFNHVISYNVPHFNADHWYDYNPQYQVDSCYYDCSVYVPNARIDVDVWK